MNYRDIVIGILVLSLLTSLYINYLQKQKLPDDQTLELLSILAEVDSKSLKSNRPDPANSGQLMNDSVAVAHLELFNQHNTRPNKKKIINPYAFAFGAEKLKGYLTLLDSINSQMPASTPDSMKIGAIRLYLTLTPVPSEKPHLDLLLVPVLNNNQNYNDIGVKSAEKTGASASYTTFNTSLPCPTWCPNDE